MSHACFSSVSMESTTDRPCVGDVIDHVTCRVCHGYLVDAVTVVRCLHTCQYSCLLFTSYVSSPFFFSRTLQRRGRKSRGEYEDTSPRNLDWGTLIQLSPRTSPELCYNSRPFLLRGVSAIAQQASCFSDNERNPQLYSVGFCLTLCTSPRPHFWDLVYATTAHLLGTRDARH